jgi:hypothetical protein
VLERLLDTLTVLVLLAAYVFVFGRDLAAANSVAFTAVKWAGGTAAAGALAALVVLSVLAGTPAKLGAPLTRMSGKQVAISGPTGREPLVGFRLRLDETSMPLQPKLPPVTKAKSSGRVRIFRSPNNQSRLRTTLESFCESYLATG